MGSIGGNGSKTIQDDEVGLAIREPVNSTTKEISTWLRDHDIWLHSSLAIQPLTDDDEIDKGADTETKSVRESSGSENKSCKLGIFLLPSSLQPPFQSGTPIAIIPKTSCLSPRTSALNPHLAKLAIDLIFGLEATSGLLLSFCLLYEKILGQESLFEGYIRSLPRERPGGQFGIWLPLESNLIDTESDRSRCSSTEVARMLQRADLRASDSATAPGWPLHSTDAVSIKLLRLFYEQTVIPFFSAQSPVRCAEKPLDLWSDFLGSYTLVSSRAFVCDTFHGLILAPLADIFNHAEPAKDDEDCQHVQQHVQFECEDMVCTRCGSLVDESSGHCRADCQQTHHSDCGGFVSCPVEEDFIYMTTVVPLCPSSARRREIYNNYGPLSPARLLASYGFATEQGPCNRWERYTWDWRSSAERGTLMRALRLTGAQGSRDPLQGGPPSTLQRWSSLVHTLTGRGVEGVVGLIHGTIDHPPADQERAESGLWDRSIPSTTGLLPLPKKSPFLGLGSVSASSSPSFSSAESLFLTSPDGSDSDYTADEILPFFLDGNGRVSTPLWISCVLAALAHHESQRHHTTATEQEKWDPSKLAHLVAQIEEQLDTKLSGRQVKGCVPEDLPRVLLESARELLYDLVRARYDCIAPAPVSTPPPASLLNPSEQGATRLAQRERSVLARTLGRLQELCTEDSHVSKELD